MKKLFLLIFVTLSFQVFSQPGKPPKKVILFENHKVFVIFRIGEGQQLSLILMGPVINAGIKIGFGF